jgi:hypothetical protein
MDKNEMNKTKGVIEFDENTDLIIYELSEKIGISGEEVIKSLVEVGFASLIDAHRDSESDYINERLSKSRVYKKMAKVIIKKRTFGHNINILNELKLEKQKSKN